MSERNKHVAALSKRGLNWNEPVVASLDAWRGGEGKSAKIGALFLTNQRVGFCRKGLLGLEVRSLPLAKLESIEASSQGGLRALKVAARRAGLRVGLSFDVLSPGEEFDAFVEALHAQTEATAADRDKTSRPYHARATLAFGRGWGRAGLSN